MWNESHWKQQIPGYHMETGGTKYHVQDFKLVYLVYSKEKNKWNQRIYVRKRDHSKVTKNILVNTTNLLEKEKNLDLETQSRC